MGKIRLFSKTTIISRVAITAILLLIIFAAYPETASAASGHWQEDDNGWRFIFEDGTYPVDQWSQIDEYWYYFGESGYMHDGWMKDNDSWYYLGSNGAMRYGWIQDNDSWYYFDSKGIMQRGWQNINGAWYYLGKADDPDSGAMATNWRKIDDRWYYFGTDGTMKRGWQYIDDSWYYLGWPNDPASGAMRTGWIYDNEKWFYMSASGKMMTDWVKDNDCWYYFLQSGEMVTGWLETEENWFYFGPNGAMMRGWQLLGDKWYYFGWPDNLDSGAMRTGTLNDENGGSYYFVEDGVKSTEGLGIDRSSSSLIVISISKQYLWYYEYGKMLIGTPIVTGNPPDYSTPTGYYSVRTKERNTLLEGPTWSSTVNYWMGIENSGYYGIHDANWRSTFGGSIYKYDGSHGCINVPYYAVSNLFSRASIGSAVRIYE